MKKPFERGLQLRAPMPPIAMGARVDEVRSRGESVLRWCLRVAAVVWMVEGVQQWLGVLTASNTVYLPSASPLHVAGLFFFCILYFVAAVGLWLVASWGIAIWIATMLGHVLALVFAPGFLADPGLLITTDAAFVIVYGGLAWTVARERRRR